MQISNLSELKLAEKRIKQIKEILAENYKNLTIFEQTTARDVRRIFQITSASELVEIESLIAEAKQLGSQICTFKGTKRGVALPKIYKDICFIRTWHHKAVSSKCDETTTKAALIGKIQKRITQLSRYDNEASRIKIIQLNEDLAQFEREEEEQFVVRGAANSDFVARLYDAKNEVTKVRLTSAGVFVVSDTITEQLKVTSFDEAKKRLNQVDIYGKLESLSYSVGESMKVYRASDVERRKEAINFSQDAVDEEKQDIQ